MNLFCEMAGTIWETFGKQDVVGRGACGHNCAQLRKKEREKCAQTLDKRRRYRV